MSDERANMQEIYIRLHSAVCQAERANGRIKELKREINNLTKELKDTEAQASEFWKGQGDE